MNYEHFTAIGGEIIAPGDILRAPFHNSAWPHQVVRLGRHRLTARPMAANGTEWDHERNISIDDCWFHITPSEARALQLPKVTA